MSEERYTCTKCEGKFPRDQMELAYAFEPGWGMLLDEKNCLCVDCDEYIKLKKEAISLRNELHRKEQRKSRRSDIKKLELEIKALKREISK